MMSFVQEAALCATLPYESSSTAFAAGEGDVQDLKEYFRRPRLVNTNLCSPSQANLWSVLVDRNRVFNLWFPGGFTRLEGVAGVRFNMVFTITVAANPFHSGVLAMSFQYDADPSDPDVWARGVFPPSCTMLPHVRLDISENTMATLNVPWYYPLDFLPLTAATPEWKGHLTVNNIVPTPVLPSSAAPTFKVYVHLEDLELLGSSPVFEQTIVAQSGLRSTQPSTGAAAPTKEKKYGGLISTSLDAASSVVGAVSRAIPSFAAIGGPTAWGLRWAARVASAFGYSKPRDETNPSRMYRTDYIGESNVDMPTVGFALAATAGNTLRVDETFSGTDHDEMAFASVLTKYSQLCLLQMGIGDTIGTRLWATNTCPYNFWFRSGTTRPFCNLAPPVNGGTFNNNCFYPTGLMFFSNFFRYWRGGLKFRFTFGKCKFHAGRVIVGFVPNPIQVNRGGRNTDPISVVEVTDSLPQPFSYTRIFDLKDGNVFELEVPYFSPFLWTGVNAYTGGVSMTVLDTLIANGECSQNISILVEVCAMDDFEFAVPCAPTITAVQGNAGLLPLLQSGLRLSAMDNPPWPEPAPEEDSIVPQSGLGVRNERDVAEYTTGETIRSLKQLIMIPSAASFGVLAGTVVRTALPNFTYLPRLNNTSPMTNPTRGWFALSRSGLISSCFAYFQGSTAYDIYMDSANNTHMSVYTAPLDNNFSNPPGQPIISVFGGGPTSNTLKVSTGLNNLHVVAPLYSYWARASIRAQYFANALSRFFSPGSTSLSYPGNTFSTPILYLRNNVGSAVCTINVSAADDARLACYIGPPVVYLFQAAQTVSPDLTFESLP